MAKHRNKKISEDNKTEAKCRIKQILDTEIDSLFDECATNDHVQFRESIVYYRDRIFTFLDEQC